MLKVGAMRSFPRARTRLLRETLPVPDDGVNLMFLSSSSLEHKAFQTSTAWRFRGKNAAFPRATGLALRIVTRHGEEEPERCWTTGMWENEKTGKVYQKESPLWRPPFRGYPETKIPAGGLRFHTRRANRASLMAFFQPAGRGGGCRPPSSNSSPAVDAPAVPVEAWEIPEPAPERVIAPERRTRHRTAKHRPAPHNQ